MVSLISATPRHNYLLYGCAVAIGFSELIGALSLHHLGYRCEVMGIRIGSALKGLVYGKVSTKLLIVAQRLVYHEVIAKLPINVC